MSEVSPPTATKKAGPTKKIKAPRKRRRGGLFNLLLIIGIIVTIGLFVWAEQQRRDARQELEQTATELEEVRQASQRSGQEVAQQVLERVRQHMVLIEEPAPTVATIVDIERLREANPFYAKADNGDHLIITAERAILYDPQEDRIIDVVPVRVDQTQEEGGEQPAEGEGTENAEGEGADTTGSPAPTPTTSPSPGVEGVSSDSGDNQEAENNPFGQ